jgi:site-specific recombinase XerD
VDQRAIAVHAFGGFVRGQEDVALDVSERLIGNQKSETVTMNGEAAADVLGIGTDSDEVTRPQFDQLAFFAQAIENIFERVTVFALEAQFANKLLEAGTGMRELANMIEKARVREPGAGLSTLVHYPQL